MFMYLFRYTQIVDAYILKYIIKDIEIFTFEIT